MIVPANLDSPQYVLSSLTTGSASVTVEEIYKNLSRVIIDNTMGTTPVFVMGSATAISVTFPTSATAASIGAIVGPGTVQTYAKAPGDNFIAAIRQSGTADLYIKLAQGD